MASLRETGEQLCISHAMGFITDAKFLLLYEESRQVRYLDFPNKSIRHFLCRTKMEPSVQAI